MRGVRSERAQRDEICTNLLDKGARKARRSPMTPLDKWIATENVKRLELRLSQGPLTSVERTEIERQLGVERVKLNPPRGPLFRR